MPVITSIGTRTITVLGRMSWLGGRGTWCRGKSGLHRAGWLL